MGSFAAGQVVLVPFPYTDQTGEKVRPALLVASAGRGDWIACQITSNPFADIHAIEVTDASFTLGGLSRTSYLRPTKVFTLHHLLFLNVLGTLSQGSFDLARHKIVSIILQ